MGKRTKNLPVIVEYERLHYYGGPYKYKQYERKDPRWRGDVSIVFIRSQGPDMF